jgi:hypothetical protein
MHRRTSAHGRTGAGAGDNSRVSLFPNTLPVKSVAPIRLLIESKTRVAIEDHSLGQSRRFLFLSFGPKPPPTTR